MQKEEWRTPLNEGETVPSVFFQTRVRNSKENEENSTTSWEWKSVPSQSLFQGKRVVLFAVPGAFTPTCSSFHLPGYIEKYDEIKKFGIDEVYCLSVNDTFVMREWGLEQGYGNLLHIHQSLLFTNVSDNTYASLFHF